MDNEQMILQAIAQLTDTVTKGFQDMEGRFEEIGVGRRIAMRALEKAGAIRADKNSRRTKVIRLDGKCQRVIIVEMGGDP